ncbi:MAG: hypothetical protein JJ902_23050 [Roseibium sp.]|nr:hypothetical protein [Roseibium sp.]
MICFIVCFGFMAGPQDLPGAAESFCAVYEKAVRNQLRLTEAEARGLRLGTKRDLAALKKTYRRLCANRNTQ